MTAIQSTTSSPQPASMRGGVANNDKAPLPLSPALPRAVSICRRLNPQALTGVERGPTTVYLEEYQRVNLLLDEAATMLTRELRRRGHIAQPVPATSATASASEQLFSHKSAATSAALGSP